MDIRSSILPISVPCLRCILILWITWLCVPAYAQVVNISGLEIISGVGRIIPHTQRFLPEVTKHGVITEVRYHKRLVDHNSSLAKINHPEFSYRLQYARFGNAEVFGEAWSFYSAVNFHLLRNTHLQWYATLGSGISWFSKYYDPITNPTNNVIGSRVNNITFIGTGIRLPITSQLKIVAESALVHMSNGSLQHPNLGINHWTASIGVNYSIAKGKVTAYEKDASYSVNRKWAHTIRTAIALQNNIIGGPAHFIINSNFLSLRKTSPNNRLGLGVTIAYNEGEYRWLVLREPENRSNARIRSTDLSINIADELRIRNTSLMGMIGYYLYDPYYKIAPIYFKVGFQQYLKLGKVQNLIIFGNLKTHFFIADYMEFGVGYSW
jgi:hypothetical protein